ncbi:MAG: S-methyl-5-thioribose-1-phosphate isomerase [Pirellulaceae bacterium]
MTANEKWETLRWDGDTNGHLWLIDQTRLPTEMQACCCNTVEDVWDAIKSLKVRGAPAIGLAAAYGVVIGVRQANATDAAALATSLDDVVEYLGTSRPTAVNLFWALERMARRGRSLLGKASPAEMLAALLNQARTLHEEDRSICRAIGRHGAPLFCDGMGVLTHCNAGGLAASEYGTALAALYAAQDEGKRLRVYVDETRPLLQGARLTAWELMQRGLDTTLICDSMAAQVMREGRIDAVITGADRIAANGDTANKIGTYGLAILARAHHIPLYVAAPQSTFDLSLDHGDQISIEERDPGEITHGLGKQTAPDNVKVYNPAFDVTRAELITALITERGVIKPVTAKAIHDAIGNR